MIDGYDGLPKFKAIHKIGKCCKNRREYLYGLFLLEYGRWKKINGVWFEYHVDFSKARYHLKRAMRGGKDVSLIEHAIGESYYRESRYCLAAAHFAAAWKKGYNLEYSFWALAESLYLRGMHDKVMTLYHEHKNQKYAYSRDMEDWLELLFCYAALHLNNIEIVKKELPSLLSHSKNVECENELYTAYVLGLAVFTNLETDDVVRLKEKVYKMKQICFEWANLLCRENVDVSHVKKTIIDGFCPAGIFPHLYTANLVL